jgi:hypothetical protein
VSLAFTVKIQNDAEIIKGYFYESTNKLRFRIKRDRGLTFSLYLLQKMG